MVDTAKCFPLLRGKAFRLTATDACGNPVPGPRSQVSTDGIVSVQLTAQTVQGQTVTVTNAAGKNLVNDVPSPRFSGYAMVISFGHVNPDMYALLSANPTVMDAAGEQAIGFQVLEGLDPDATGFAMEMWSDVPADQCEVGAGQVHGYMVLPFSKGGVLGDFTVQNDAVSFTLTGAQTKKGNAWGVGPYDVVLDETDTPSPLLEALPSNLHLHMQLTAVAPPTEVCGALPLGTKATGATAGEPGSFTPATSMTYAPENLADMTGVTASPGTAWTTGQRVITRSGAAVHWSGSAWVAGPA